LKPDLTVRLAHSSPIYLSGPGQIWDSGEDAAYFVKWIDDLIGESEADPTRFQNAEQKKEVIGTYLAARTHYGRNLR
jgi:hypothetical protein